MVAYNVHDLIKRVDELLAYDVSLRIAQEFMPTPSDEYADWQNKCRKEFGNMQNQIYKLILEF